ncbi:hypothetical protein U1Q18_037594, partial [Sarracenia purpurea var. burkii]
MASTSQVGESDPGLIIQWSKPMPKIGKMTYKEVLHEKPEGSRPPHTFKVAANTIVEAAEGLRPNISDAKDLQTKVLWANIKEAENYVAEDVETEWLKDFNGHQKGKSAVGTQKENNVCPKSKPKRRMKVAKEKEDLKVKPKKTKTKKCGMHHLSRVYIIL